MQCKFVTIQGHGDQWHVAFCQFPFYGTSTQDPSLRDLPAVQIIQQGRIYSDQKTAELAAQQLAHRNPSQPYVSPTSAIVTTYPDPRLPNSRQLFFQLGPKHIIIHLRATDEDAASAASRAHAIAIARRLVFVPTRFSFEGVSNLS